MPAKRVLISIDERILARIDEAAQRRGETRSGFLARAAMAHIDETSDMRQAQGGQSSTSRDLPGRDV
jgi:metal-responsive CopG/Arc/MetJ family transcriptional regulator